MKKHSRLTALMLLLLLIFSVAACNNAPLGENSTEQTEETSPAAETTNAPVTSETTSEDTTEVTVEQTYNKDPEDILRILKQKDLNIITLFGDEENKTLSDARAERFLREYAAAIKISEVENIISAVENDPEIHEYDLLMTDPQSGIKLLIGAHLENLDEAGISINSESAGVRKSLTESLSFGGTYLIACDALSSYLPASYALKYNGEELSSDPADAALGGSFTVELMLTYISEETGDCLAVGDTSPLIIYRGVGGHIYAKDEKGLPAGAMVKHEAFSDRYTRASSLYALTKKTSTGIFTLEKLTYSPGSVWLPLPKAEANIEYSSPLDTNGVVLFAAPAGVVDGGRLSRLFTAYNLVSSDYRDAARAKLYDASVKNSAELIALIESSATIDLGPILGWGDLDLVIEDGIIAGTPASAILSDRIVKMQNEAIESAAAIIAGRLGID